MQGVFLRKNVIEIAGRALKTNIRSLAPRVLPWIEQVGKTTSTFLLAPFPLPPMTLQRRVLCSCKISMKSVVWKQELLVSL